VARVYCPEGVLCFGLDLIEVARRIAYWRKKGDRREIEALAIKIAQYTGIMTLLDSNKGYYPAFIIYTDPAADVVIALELRKDLILTIYAESHEKCIEVGK